MDFFHLEILCVLHEKVDKSETSRTVIAVTQVHCPTGAVNAGLIGLTRVVHVANDPSSHVCNPLAIQENDGVLECFRAGQLAL